MDDKIIDILATPKLMPEIVALAEAHGIEASQPMAVDSSSDALDAPLGIDEARQVLEVVTLFATTGTTVVSFLAAVKALIGRFEEDDGSAPKAKLVETKTRRNIGTLDTGTDLDDLRL